MWNSKVSHVLIQLFCYNPIKLNPFSTDVSNCNSICVGRQIQVLQKRGQYEETEEAALTTKHIIT